jgi:hypothetical protein
MLSVVIVRVCGRSSNQEKLNLARLPYPAAPGLLDAPLKAGHDNREIGDCSLSTHGVKPAHDEAG